jgi:Fur family ferric uptake transcriptional regulator
MVATRLTKQKKAILSYLKKVYTHPTAEIIYEAVKDELPKISLATVYRNLHQMALQGDILELEINGEFHYDGHLTAHQHAICSSCGKIIDIHNKKINNYLTKKISEIKGFVPRRANVFFEGLCEDCNKSKTK